MSRLDEGVIEGGESGFESSDAEGGVAKVELFLKLSVRGVVGGDDVKDTSLEAV